MVGRSMSKSLSKSNVNTYYENVKIGNPIGNLYRKHHVLILIELNDGKFLLGTKDAFYPKHIARLVGGGRNESEDAVRCAQREVFEELALSIPIERFIPIAKVITEAETTEGSMQMDTGIFGIKLDINEERQIVAGDDLSGYKVFNSEEYYDLVRDIFQLNGAYQADTFSFEWKDWGVIYGPIHEIAMSGYLSVK